MAEVKPVVWYEQDTTHGVLKDGDTLPVTAIPADVTGITEVTGAREEVTIDTKKVFVGILEALRNGVKTKTNTLTTALRSFSLQNNRTLTITARRYLGNTVQDEDSLSVNLPFPAVTRRTVTAGIVLQIERCPVTSMQTVRMRGVVPSTLAPTTISWASHPFADDAIITNGTGGVQITNLTPTTGVVTVNKAGPFMAVLQGSY